MSEADTTKRPRIVIDPKLEDDVSRAKKWQNVIFVKSGKSFRTGKFFNSQEEAAHYHVNWLRHIVEILQGGDVRIFTPDGIFLFSHYDHFIPMPTK